VQRFNHRGVSRPDSPAACAKEVGKQREAKESKA